MDDIIYTRTRIHRSMHSQDMIARWDLDRHRIGVGDWIFKGLCKIRFKLKCAIHFIIWLLRLDGFWFNYSYILIPFETNVLQCQGIFFILPMYSRFALDIEHCSFIWLDGARLKSRLFHIGILTGWIWSSYSKVVMQVNWTELYFRLSGSHINISSEGCT